ncbi:MAG: TrbG/VirB9 family P-type conjugative transfer protein [Gammaproteobacteria bacterium]|nr:TrbG/VirB9 family P-type conjugative transfer protein [Gammaproteobacteria bacterium]
MKTGGVVALLALFGCLRVGAEALPVGSPSDSRIRTAIFNPGEVYRLYAHVGYALELIFEEGESGAGQAGGDLDAIALAWHDNRVIIKPKAARVGTNLIIYTNRRAYRFDYSASVRRPDPATEPVMYAVQFIYPAMYATPKPTTSNDAANVARALGAGGSERAQNIDYWFCGSSSLKPQGASDDGVHTRLKFGSRREVPAVFVRNEDGTESLLNFSMEGANMVIHRVAPKFILRRGALTACLVNKGYAGSGEHLPSGTVAPGVDRERREAAE